MAERIKGAFLKLTGPDIKGNVTDKGYEDQIACLSVSFGVSNDARAVELVKEKTGGGRSSNILDVAFVKEIDNSSSQLNGHCTVGTLFDEAIITVVDGDPIYTLTLSPVVISSVSTGLLPEGGSTESVTLNFARSEWQYKTESPDWWDAANSDTSIS